MTQFSTMGRSLAVVTTLAVAMGAPARVASAGAEIPFDVVAFDEPTKVFDWDAFRGYGMLASSEFTLCNVLAVQPDAFSSFLAEGGTPDNALILAALVGQYELDLIFVMPGTDDAAMTDSVSMLFFDTNVGTSAGWLEAYDIDGKLIDRVEATTPASMLITLRIDAPGIHRLRIGTDFDGAIIDNFKTGDFTMVPGPAGLALLGLAVLRGRRRRA